MMERNGKKPLTLVNGKEMDHCIRKPIAASKTGQHIRQHDQTRQQHISFLFVDHSPLGNHHVPSQNITVKRRHLAIHLWPGLGGFPWSAIEVVANQEFNATESSTKNFIDRSIENCSIKNGGLNHRMKNCTAYSQPRFG